MNDRNASLSEQPFYYNSVLPELPANPQDMDLARPIAYLMVEWPSARGGVYRDRMTYQTLLVLLTNHPDIWESLHEDLNMPLRELSDNERERLWQLEARWEKAKGKLRELRYMKAAREALECLEMDGDGNSLEEAS